MNEALSKYLKNARSQGLTDDQIRQQLRNSGWSSIDIESALNPSAHSVPPPPPAPGAKHRVSGQPNVGMAVLAYLGILIVIPFLVAKDDPFVKFHIKQGLVLLIIEAILWMLSYMSWGFFVLILYPLISLGILVLIIVGIVHAVQGKQKELPIVGQFADKFNF